MKTLELEVFRAGDYGERGHWSEEILDQIAADYAPETHEAPVTVDHAQSGPALGWVEGIRRVGDVLVARLRDLAPAFAEMVQSGAYKKRSVEIYPALRETGRPYLRAVSFLGACPPEVKGLRDVVFAEESEEPVSIGFHTSEPVMAWSEIREELKGKGRWLPAWEDHGIEAFWEALGDEEQRIWFREFLSAMPAAIPTEQVALPKEPTQFGEQSIPQSTPRCEVSSTSVALHRRALAFREEQPGVSYAEALRSVALGA